MREMDISRRRMIAGLGVTGATSVVGLGAATKASVAYTDRMVITDQNGFTIEADWRETYNGRVIEDTRASETADGAVISLADVVPGDSGTFSFRLAVGEDDPSVEPQLSLDLTGTAENGINEPEEDAGDSSPDRSELQEHLDVKLWYDEGLMNYDVFGGDNATQDPGESLISPGAEGTLAEVAENVNGVPLDANGCITSDDTVTVSFKWGIDSGVGNVIQSDSVTFDFTITGEICQ